MASSTFKMETSLGGFLFTVRGVDKFHDVTLQCSGGELISAHRIILAAHSRLFNALLDDKPVFHLPIAEPIMQIVMQLMYTGYTRVTDDQRQKFTEVIELLDIRDLTENFERQDYVESTRLSPDLSQESYRELFRTRLSAIINQSNNSASDEIAAASNESTEKSSRTLQSSHVSDSADDEVDDGDNNSDDNAGAGSSVNSVESAAASIESAEQSSRTLQSSHVSDSADNDVDDGEHSDDSEPESEAGPSDDVSAQQPITSPEEILNNLLDLQDTYEAQESSKALRYWLAVIVRRFDYGAKERISFDSLSANLQVDATKLRRVMGLRSVDFDYAVPKSKSNRHRTSAEEIVTALCRSPNWPEDTDETLPLRLWMAVVYYKLKTVDRTTRALEHRFGISSSKIHRGSKNKLAPAETHYGVPAD